MRSERSRARLAARQLEGAARASRLWRESDCLQVAVVELEQFGVGDVPARLLKRVGDRRAIDGSDVGQEINKLVGQLGVVDCRSVGRYRRRNRRDLARGFAEWGNQREKHEEQHNDDYVLGPPEYPSCQLHSGPRYEVCEQVLQYHDNGGSGPCACQRVPGRANPFRPVKQAWAMTATTNEPTSNSKHIGPGLVPAKERRSTCQ